MGPENSAMFLKLKLKIAKSDLVVPSCEKSLVIYSKTNSKGGVKVVVEKVEGFNDFQEIQILPSGTSERNFQKCFLYDIKPFTTVSSSNVRKD